MATNRLDASDYQLGTVVEFPHGASIVIVASCEADLRVAWSRLVPVGPELHMGLVQRVSIKAKDEPDRITTVPHTPRPTKKWTSLNGKQ